MGHTVAEERTAIGTVKNVIEAKGFGFITTADGTEYFFHRTEAVEFSLLKSGTKVSFIPTKGSRGPRAEHVVRV